MELEKAHLQYIVEHVFLPPKLPQAYDVETEQKDESLYKFIAEASQRYVEALKESHGASPRDLQIWQQIDEMLQHIARIHQLHHLVKEDLEVALEEMKVGAVLPLHIAAQNAGVIFRKVGSRRMTFEAFELSLPTETITGTVGKVVQRFPSNPRLPFSIEETVISAMANVLSYFSDNAIDDAIPTTVKGGSRHHEVRQTVSPRYITEALAGVIRACPPAGSATTSTPYIHKRINDHALWKSALKPWRRTPSLLLIKVAVQSTLEEKDVDKAHGYKTFWAFMMSLIMEEALMGDTQVFTIDLLHFMNLKLARRLAKLGQYVENDSIRPLTEASASVHRTSEALEHRWRQVQDRSSSIVQWHQLEVMSISGINFRFPNSQDCLQRAINRQTNQASISVAYDGTMDCDRLSSACAPRLSLSSNLPTSIPTQELDVGLFDFEKWVQTHLSAWSASPSRSPADCLPLYSIADEYRRLATLEYKDDPERQSLMHLCIVELWMSLDKIVCDWCSLLTTYTPEIPEDFLDPLLLPTFDQLKRLYKVQLYLQGRQRKAKIHGCHSLFGDIYATTSFQNRFFETPQASSLIALESRMQRYSEVQKLEKLKEIEDRNKEYNSLMDEALSMECNDSFYKDRRGNRIHGHAHWQCKRCKKEKQAQRCKVKPLEALLPSQQSRARPIVFELQTPLPISIWRDFTAGIVFLSNPEPKPETELYPLQSYYPLVQFFKSALPDHLQVLALASSAKSVNMSHYGKERPCPVDEEAIFKKHAGNYRLFDLTSKTWVRGLKRKDLRTDCTLPMEGPYRALQQYAASTTHSPNTVLASINSCPSEIPTAEYVAFCQLRSGVRIQWLNIMRAIRAQTLTFSEPSVVALVLQSIWQAEDLGDARLYREAHHVLQDHGFGIDVGKELYIAVRSLGDNWKQYLYLSILVALAFRLLEISPHTDVMEKAKGVIYAARELAKSWMIVLKQSPLDNAASQTSNSTNCSHTRQSIASIAIVFRSTFEGGCGTSLCTKDAIWFIYAGTLAAFDINSLAKSLHRLVRRDKRIALQMEKSIANMCRIQPSILDKVIDLAWPGYIRSVAWSPVSVPADRWWTTKSTNDGKHQGRFLHLNLVDGTLLIDGRVSDRLPSSYTGHPVYKALLEDYVFLDVRPSTMKGMVYEVNYRDSKMHLGLNDSELLIQRQLGDVIEEYIPSTMLQEDLPIALVTGHHYWYIDNIRLIEIRPKSQRWDSIGPGQWKIRLFDSSNVIQGRIQRGTASGENVLLDPHSALYRSLSRALRPLEPNERGLIITRNPEDILGVTFVSIPRHDLSFQLNMSGHLESQSFPGYIVKHSRDGVGCLFGLDTFLSLSPSDNRQKTAHKILVPRGIFSSKLGYHGHPTITIEVGDHGGYFAYDVDSLVGRLVGNRTIESDLYLVQLHALTSSPLSDPLTCRSGTTEALDRLQSAACSSVLNISANARKYLEDIAKLTPLRSSYPPHLNTFKMETVDWSHSLPASSQHPSFRSAVQGILHKWRETLLFHQNEELVKELDTPKGMAHLSARECLHSALYMASCQIHNRPKDLQYEGRDSLTTVESQMRERRAFETASLTKQSSRYFPVCRSLPTSVDSWGQIRGDDCWEWQDIQKWLKTPQIPHISSMWCTLFELCRRTRWPPSFEVTMAIGLLGFSGIPGEILASLVSVIQNTIFLDPEYACPPFNTIDLAEGCHFNREIVEQFLRDCAIDVMQSQEYQMKRRKKETMEERWERIGNTYTLALDSQIEEAIDELEAQWEESDGDVSEYAYTMTRRRLLDFSSYQDILTQTITSWSKNRAFLHHIDLVTKVFNTCRTSMPSVTLYIPAHPDPSIHAASDENLTLPKLMSSRAPPPNMVSVYQPPVQSRPPVVKEQEHGLMNLLSRLKESAAGPFERRYLVDLERSIEALNSPQLLRSDSVHDITRLQSRRDECWKTAQEFFNEINSTLRPRDKASRLIEASGMWPCVTPHVLLRCLSIGERAMIPSEWVDLLVGYAVRVHDAKRYDRILRHAFAGHHDQLAAEKYYFRAFQPATHPDWMLFEIDSDVSIRSAQAELALEMIDPPAGKNSVMQLNMGEGKSSVIVPIVAASVGAKGGILSRVIVPRAQTNQQFQFLRRALTSLCNRPIVYLPFNRQLQLTAETVTGIQKFLRNLANVGGIWLCEPEQLLSLKLLGLDKRLHQVPGIDNGGSELTQLQTWLNNNTQDILDESDEVLQTRQQVIYTVGAQRNLDASPRRWEITQQLLGLLAAHLIKLREAGEDLFGLYVENSNERISGFPYIRIQSDTGRRHLERFIKVTFNNNEWSIPQTLKAPAIDFIISKTPSEETIQAIETYCEEDPRIKNTLLILRGLIHYDILLHGLKDKRWRVEYGLDLKRTRLAIPYRAKDFPALRSEFGHPDVTILLTCLAYYYGGLDEEMARRAVKRLLRSATPDQTYSDWLNDCRSQVPKELQTIRGINMDDDQVLTANLFPFLRFNKRVIDFYLNSFVFPKQAREFSHKLLSSGWDLAAQKRYTTAGFSGTNDSRFLLPIPISQVDRPSQLHTNAKVLSRLLLDENKTVVRYPDEYKSMEILDYICNPWHRVTVILDVGAQILDYTNREFARSWLKRHDGDDKISAAVFFDEEGSMSVLTRDGVEVPFLNSPYANTLDRCLVYLDDVHTRGTDLRLPPSHAVVTLGPRLTKDKLVQGCMRMRRLGDGHKLTFMASDEVLRLITVATGCPASEITATEVVIWTIKESWRQAQADLPAWVQQGKSFMRREVGWKELPHGRITKERIHSLFCEPEARSLESLYGIGNNVTGELLRDVDTKNEIGRGIVKHCNGFGSMALYDATILEEMEIELVHEKENEREIEEVPSAEPAQHTIHEDVIKFIKTGIIPSKSPGFFDVQRALFSTSLKFPGGIKDALSALRVTRDFYSTIILDSTPIPGIMDHFLRPVEWIVRSVVPGISFIVALSPYEVNQLLPQIRSSKLVRLHVFAPRVNLAMATLEDLNHFMLPEDPSRSPLPRSLALQLNLFAGSLYLRDYAMYKNVCTTLRLQLDDVPRHLAKPGIIELSGFVRNVDARTALGLVGPGFKANPLPLFRKLLMLRRYNQRLGPSHMGKLLYGTALHKGKHRDFDEESE